MLLEPLSSPDLTLRLTKIRELVRYICIQLKNLKYEKNIYPFLFVPPAALLQ